MKTNILILLLSTISFAAYAQDDDIYYSPKDPKPAKEIKSNNSSDRFTEPEKSYVSQDTVFYTKSKKNEKGEVTSYEEGYYLDSTQSNYSNMSDNEDSDYTYSNRLRRFHNSTIIIDNDPYYYNYYSDGWYGPRWSYSYGYRPGYSWSLGFGYNYGYYGYYDPWYYNSYPYYGYYYPHYHHSGWVTPYYSSRSYGTENARRNTFRGSNYRFDGRASNSYRSSGGRFDGGSTTYRSAGSSNDNGGGRRSETYNNRSSSDDNGRSYRSGSDYRSNNSGNDSGEGRRSYNNSGSRTYNGGGSRSYDGGSYRGGSVGGGSRSYDGGGSRSGGSYDAGGSRSGGSYGGGSRSGGRR